MKKLHSIQSIITAPFIGLTIVIPFITLITFNLFITNYTNKIDEKKTERSLIQTSLSINELIEAQFSQLYIKKGPKQTEYLESNLQLLRNTPIFSTDVDIILLNDKHELTFPTTFENSFLTDDIIKTIQILLDEDLQDLSVRKISSQNEDYRAVIFQLNYIQSNPYLVYVTRVERGDSLIKTTNMIIFSIMIVGLMINVILTLLLSKSISKPIKLLSKYAKKLGSDEFEITEANETAAELYQLHTVLNESAKQLAAYDERQRKFLQNVSHELRTPLMSIQGYSEGIIKNIIPDNKMAAQIIYDESNRLTNLIAQILTLSRVESHMYNVTLTPVNLSDIVKDYVQRLTGLAIKELKELHLNIHYKKIMVDIDEELLSNVILNVLSNCIRYANKHVTIEVTASDTEAIIIISDDGNGFNEEDLPHVFERFYKGKSGKFGLGLAIAKSSVENMNGLISCENTNSGARFNILLPLLNAQTKKIIIKNNFFEASKNLWQTKL